MDSFTLDKKKSFLFPGNGGLYIKKKSLSFLSYVYNFIKKKLIKQHLFQNEILLFNFVYNEIKQDKEKEYTN